MGHGASMNSNDPSYQLSVPFMIWTSSLFKEKYPDTIRNLENKTKIPILTKDLSHVLIGISNIKTKDYAQERDFLNENMIQKNIELS